MCIFANHQQTINRFSMLLLAYKKKLIEYKIKNILIPPLVYGSMN